MPEAQASGRAIKIAVYAALTYDIISATNSSPQTTEINAATRAETLMKWVKIGLLQAAGFAILGVLVDDEHWPPAVGAGIAGILLWIQYKHAEQSGLESGGAPTEVYGGTGSNPVQPVEPQSTEEPETSAFTELPAMA